MILRNLSSESGKGKKIKGHQAEYDREILTASAITLQEAEAKPTRENCRTKRPNPQMFCQSRYSRVSSVVGFMSGIHNTVKGRRDRPKHHLNGFKPPRVGLFVVETSFLVEAMSHYALCHARQPSLHVSGSTCLEPRPGYPCHCSLLIMIHIAMADQYLHIISFAIHSRQRVLQRSSGDMW